MKNKYRKWMAGKLVMYRRGTGMNQQRFADLIEKKQRTYAAYEEGRCEPSIATLEIICEVLNITIDKFMSDSPHKVKS